jgi:hypothetical protein
MASYLKSISIIRVGSLYWFFIWYGRNRFQDRPKPWRAASRILDYSVQAVKDDNHKTLKDITLAKNHAI